MAKKKITPQQEADAQRIINKMTPEELEQMDAFEKEFNKMPKEMQEALFEFAQNLNKMPEKKRKELFDTFDRLDSYFADNNWDDEGPADFGEDLDDDFGDADYPHYIPDSKALKYTLRITIKDHKPAIYRKFSVPSNISLRHLSELLIDIMGWSGGHLNQFRKGNDYYAPAYQRDGEIPSLFGPARDFNQEEFSISDILSEKGKTIEWEYDFGDSWCHDVRLSSVDDYSEGEPPVSFIKGERACPPEDCGGIWGYEDLLDAYDRFQKYTMHAGKKPSTEELDRLSWYGMDGDFDPEKYDAEAAREICETYCD